MDFTPKLKEKLEQREDMFKLIGQRIETYLEELPRPKFLNYLCNIQTDTLLSFQNQRTILCNKIAIYHVP